MPMIFSPTIRRRNCRTLLVSVGVLPGVPDYQRDRSAHARGTFKALKIRNDTLIQINLTSYLFVIAITLDDATTLLRPGSASSSDRSARLVPLLLRPITARALEMLSR
jgi:hypothetical protein